MSAYQGFSEPQDVIEARKDRILGKAAKRQAAGARWMAKFAKFLESHLWVIPLLVSLMVDLVALGIAVVIWAM